ncbi:MAG: hypothetical protein IPO08_18445 [Xanthomonadales bacterium]|nr:hypothetical protein [Xanthomonadales bacterium]
MTLSVVHATAPIKEIRVTGGVRRDDGMLLDTFTETSFRVVVRDTLPNGRSVEAIMVMAWDDMEKMADHLRTIRASVRSD